MQTPKERLELTHPLFVVAPNCVMATNWAMFTGLGRQSRESWEWLFSTKQLRGRTQGIKYTILGDFFPYDLKTMLIASDAQYVSPEDIERTLKL